MGSWQQAGGQAGGHPRSPGGLSTGPPLCPSVGDQGSGSISGLLGGGERGLGGRERAGLCQQPFPGELLTEAIISGSSSQAGNEGGLISERLPLHHFHLPTFRLLPPVLPATSPLRRSTMALPGDKAASSQGARKEVCVQGSQGVWVCVHCTRTAHVPPDMLMRQCTHAIRCAHIGICVLACTHTHTQPHPEYRGMYAYLQTDLHGNEVYPDSQYKWIDSIERT